ncbi:MAG: thiol:disulfide interchange protein DsbA/DsbL [Granulosicoccus sp.]|nr:thiol:disulfide interchange protein DsbA/DsbL [Granulosicoccus sp.]
MLKIRRRLIAITATLLCSVALSSSASAAERYELIDPPQNTSNPDTVEVLEFFWLGCPHCYSLEPTIEAWQKDIPSNVTFVREAPPLNPSWEQHSRGFYAAQLLNQEHAFVEAMFKAIHEDGKRMRKPGEVADLAAELGMDRDKFLKTMKSFAVQTRMNRSIQLAKGAGITGVPAIIINGKYRTGAQLAGGNAGIVDVINETIAMEKQSMGLE